MEITSFSEIAPSVCPSVSPSVRYKSCLSDSSLTTKANLMKLPLKIKDNEKVCRAHDLGSYASKVKVTIRSRSKSCLSNNSKTTEANLTKLHRKIEHNEKVCRAQELDSYAYVKVKIMSKVKLCLKLCFS